MNDTITPVLRTAKVKFNRNEQVCLVGSRLSRPKTATVVDTYEFKEAVKLRDAKGEFISTAGEVVTVDELEALKNEQAQELREELKAKYKDIIDLWESGKRSASEIAMLLDRHHLAVASQIAAAKRAGFIN